MVASEKVDRRLPAATTIRVSRRGFRTRWEPHVANGVCRTTPVGDAVDMNSNGTQTRREFLRLAVIGTAGLAVARCGGDTPTGTGGGGGGGTLGPTKLKAVGSYPANSVTLETSVSAFVIRTDAGFSARSSVCTHQGCTPNWTGSQFACPCHGSRFEKDGSVANGPANSPLVSYEVTMQEGFVYVNRLKTVSATTVTPVS